MRSKRTRLLIGVTLVVAALAGTTSRTAPPSPAPQQAAQRPNVLFIMADDLNDDMGAFGHVRTELYRYVAWDEGKAGEELFDELNDPGETRNLAGQPFYAGVLGEMRQRLARARAGAR